MYASFKLQKFKALGSAIPNRLCNLTQIFATRCDVIKLNDNQREYGINRWSFILCHYYIFTSYRYLMPTHFLMYVTTKIEAEKIRRWTKNHTLNTMFLADTEFH